MSELNAKIIDILTANRNELLIRVVTRLQALSNSHYAMMDFESQQKREALMLEAFIDTVRDLNNDRFIAYIEAVAVQRLNEGYSLIEVQHAFRTFEEQVWDMLTTSAPVDTTLIEMLKIITHIFGRGKDHLARGYLERSMAIQIELEEVRKRFSDYRFAAKKK